MNPPESLSDADKTRWMQCVERISVLRATTPENSAALGLQAVKLKTLWNSSLPINRLPTELLVSIFIFTFPTSNVTHLPFATPDKHSPLMRICRRWYYLARSSPTLWRAVRVGPLPRALEHLARCLKLSATSSLHISIHDYRKEIYTLIYPEVHRVEVLEIIIVDGFWATVLSVEEFLALKTLRIKCSSSVDSTLHLLPTHFPQLRSLDLEGVELPNDARIYARLRVLRLRNCYSDLPKAAFLDILSTCPDLEELVLVQALAGDQVRDPPVRLPLSRPRTVLRRMKKLQIADNVEDPEIIPQFLKRIVLPSSAYVNIICSPSWPNEPQGDPMGIFMRALHPNALSSFPSISHVTHAKLYYMWANDHSDSEKGEFRLSGRGADGLALVDYEFIWRRHFSQLICFDLLQVLFVRDLFHGAPLTHLKITPGDAVCVEIKVGEWLDTFTTFPTLEELHIDGWSTAKHLWSALQPESGAALLCPQLRSISLQEIWSSAIAQDDSETRAFFDGMVDALRARGAKGARLEKLDIKVEYIYKYSFLDSERERHCAIRDAYVSDLEQLVEEVNYTVPPPSVQWSWVSRRSGFLSSHLLTSYGT